MFLWIDSDLPDGVGVVPEPEGKPSTQLQAWSNLGIVWTAELISVASHMSYRMLNYCTPYIACLCNTHIPGAMAGVTASVQGMGELLQLCVSHLRGFVWFFPLRRGEERRTSSYDPRGWGHLPKELFASCPSVKYGWQRPPGLRRLGADFSVVLLPRLLTPRRDNPRVEWMLSHFYECYSDHSFTVTPAGLPATVIRLKYYAIIL